MSGLTFPTPDEQLGRCQDVVREQRELRARILEREFWHCEGGIHPFTGYAHAAEQTNIAGYDCAVVTLPEPVAEVGIALCALAVGAASRRRHCLRSRARSASGRINRERRRAFRRWRPLLALACLLALGGCGDSEATKQVRICAQACDGSFEWDGFDRRCACLPAPLPPAPRP